MEDKKRNARIARATEIFTYCMESNDPKLDEVIWLKTLPLSNPRANQVRNYSEAISVRKAILATLFEFPECINIDNRTINDEGVEYYEGKSEFVASVECTAEQQQEIVKLKERLEEVASQLGDSVTSGEKGNITLYVNLWLDIGDIDFDNIVEWLNSYCARNVDRVGTRSTEYIYVNVTREALTRAGIEANDFRWRKLVNEKDRIGSRDIVEAVEIKEVPEAISKRTAIQEKLTGIKKYFEDKSIERFQRRMGRISAREAERDERARWDFRM